MPSGVFELRAESDTATFTESATPLQWPTEAGQTSSVRSDLGWWMQEAGHVPDAAIDLVRLAGGAYLADRLTTRPASFTRTMQLRVAVTHPDRWSGGPADAVADLLHWLTGDQWTLTLFQDPTEDRRESPRTVEPDRAPTSLLSGGLDSFLGALHLLEPGSAQPQFLGHADSATAVRHAQWLVAHWLGSAYSPPPSYSRLRFSQAERKAENSSRSRSLLFMALGSAAAAANHSDTLYVPENGYTSLNIPLHPSRAGALSTRSTHPTTLQRVNALLAALDLAVQIADPFADLTKGEEMAKVAAQPPPPGWEEAAAMTVSCGKLDGRTFEGGNPNLNCGLCYPCVVRRGAFLAAGVTDQTIYLSDALTGDRRTKLLAKRRSDREAIAYAIEHGPDENLIDASTWPDGFDLDQATEPSPPRAGGAIGSGADMSLLLDGPPALDCHAHIAADVTPAQIRALGAAHVFAVTRTLAESNQVLRRRDAHLTWGLGVHPGVRAARTSWNPEQFAVLLPNFALVGEIGLDRRAGYLPAQQAILRDILRQCSGEQVLLSIHSTGATAAVTDLLSEQPHPGAILHWFLGTRDEINAATKAGAYFSVNASMSHAALAALPDDRVLPETDFPARQTRAKRPADVTPVEQAISEVWGITLEQVRMRLWRNLQAIASAARVLDRLPEALGDLLLEF